MNIKGKIGIIGCGWLGLPLGQFLITKGYLVVGTTTNPDKINLLKEKGINPFQLQLLESEIKENLFILKDCECLIISIPPGRQSSDVSVFEQKIKNLIKAIIPICISKIIFISSTSVYGNQKSILNEMDVPIPEKPSGQTLLRTEYFLNNHPSIEATIVRFGGLIGYDRNPGRFLAGKKDVPNGNAPVNLIHQDDCIQIIYQIIHQKKWNKTYNACSPIHPSRKEYYTRSAEILDLEIPTFSEIENNNKTIDSSFLMADLKYTFIHESPLTCLF